MDLAIINEFDALRNLASKPFRAVCYAPWTSMVFDSVGKVRVCCANFEYPLGDISKERLDDIWTGERVEKMRRALRDYEMHLGCGVCHWKIENGAFRTQSLNDSALITLKYEDFEIEPGPPYWPKHMEFHLSNRCNLECVTCFGEFSSGIRKNREKLPPYPMAYTDQFFEDLEKYLPHLKWTQFLGGEPFIIPEMHRVWNMLIERGLAPNCHITTNGTVWGPKVERILDLLPVSIAVSMDGATKETFEAIRLNAKFDRVRENLRRFRDHCRAHGQTIIINFTLSRMNWCEVPDMLLFAEDEGVDLQILDLFSPESMSILTLPPNDLARVVSELERRAEEIRPRLTRLAPSLDAKLSELRYRLQHSSEKSLYQYEESSPLLDVPIDELIQTAWAQTEEAKQRRARNEKLARTANEKRLLNKDSLSVSEIEFAEPLPIYAWHRFVNQTDVPTIADARQRLTEWSPDRSMDQIDCDETDTVVAISSDPEGILAGATNAIGRSLESFVAILGERLGNKFELLESNDDPANFLRTVRFSDDEKGATQVRVIYVPRHDESGTVLGVTLVLAHRPEPTLAETH